MGANENRQVVLGFADAISHANLDAINAALADDATWWIAGSLPVSGTHRGKKAINDLWLLTVAPLFEPGSLSVSVQNTIAEGDQVAVEWIARCKTTKGKAYENYYNLVFIVKNGKIQTIREYVDTLHAKEMLFS